MYLSASVLAAAVLSSALTINSSGHEGLTAISGTASDPGPDPSLHTPDILISKRGGLLVRRSAAGTGAGATAVESSSAGTTAATSSPAGPMSAGTAAAGTAAAVASAVTAAAASSIGAALAPGESLVPGAGTTSGTNATTEAGAQTKPGPLTTAAEANVIGAPVVKTTSTDISEAAATYPPAVPGSNTTHASNGTAKLPDKTAKIPGGTAKMTDASTSRHGVTSKIAPGTANRTATSVPPIPTPRPWKFADNNSTAASTSTRAKAGTNTTGLAMPTHVSVQPVSVPALASVRANVTFPESFVIVNGAAYFPRLVRGSGYFRVVVDMAASLVFRIERCQRDERNTVVVKAKGEYRYLECGGAECNTVVRVEACGIVRVAPCAGQCDASVFCQRAGQCVDAGQRPALPRAPGAATAAAARVIKVTTNIAAGALARVDVTPQGCVTGLIRAVAEVQASRGGGTVSILVKAFPKSPDAPALLSSPASGGKPAPNAGSEEAPEAPASSSGTMLPSSDSDKGPAAHGKTAATSLEHKQGPESAAEGGVSPKSGSRTAPIGAPAQSNSAAADSTVPRPQHAATSHDQPPAAPKKATTGPDSLSNDRVSPSRPQDQRPGNGLGQAPASALKAAASRHVVGAYLAGALAVLVLIA